jgi:formylglycine-generating enzyme required for sulfatase activity
MERPSGSTLPDDVSGARTLVFEAETTNSGGTAHAEAKEAPTASQSEQEAAQLAETSALAGDSQSDPEKQGLTSELEKGRKTAPVESAESTLLTTEALVRDGSSAQDVNANQANSPSVQDATVGLGAHPEDARIAGLRTVEHSQTGAMGAQTLNPPPLPGQTGQVAEDRPGSASSAAQTTAFGGPVSSTLSHGFGATHVETVSPPATAAHPVQKTKSNTALISIIVGLIVIGSAGYLAYWFVAGGARPTNRQPEVIAPPPPAVPPPVVEAPKPLTPPEGMVLVAAGKYTVGRDEGDKLERPAHVVDLKPFFIDRTEVTNAQYKKFVDATGHAPPSGWIDGSYPPEQAEWPVTGVTWQDAVDYAQWAGKRLPTEAEWEAAARGVDGRLYPWGTDWKPGLANIGSRGITPVGQFQGGASPVGTLDMIGNVWEWTSDEFQPYPGSVAPMPKSIDPALTYRVIRGGAYDGNKSHNACYRGFIDAAKGYEKTGFRCVKPVEASGQ